MRRVHPLWRGFWLAAVYTAALAFSIRMDWLDAWRGQALALVLAAAAGAFLASLPGRLRKRENTPRSGQTRLVCAFLSGAAMTLACGMAGSGRILPALMEGSTGAYAFLGTAGLTAFITVRIAGRRARI